MAVKGKYYEELLRNGYEPHTKEWSRARQRLKYERENGREYRNAQRIKYRKEHGDAINATQREWYNRNRAANAADQHARRIKREPHRGLETLVRSFENGSIDHDEYCRRLNERVALASQRNVRKRAGGRRKNAGSGQSDNGSPVRPHDRRDNESEG